MSDSTTPTWLESPEEVHSAMTIEFVPILDENYLFGPYCNYSNLIDPEWVSVNPNMIKLDSYEWHADFVISVALPEDLDIGYYEGQIAVRTDNNSETAFFYGVLVSKPQKEQITEN